MPHRDLPCIAGTSSSAARAAVLQAQLAHEPLCLDLRATDAFAGKFG